MEDIQGEIWKPIIYNGIDYTGLYEVSNMGRIRNVKKNTFLKPSIKKGYKNIRLCYKGRILVKVHKLVIIAFDRVPFYDKKEVIDHINSQKDDNRLENLRIVTIRENSSKEKTIKSGLPCGVYFVKIRSNYYIRAQFKIIKDNIGLGLYKTIESASNAYNLAVNLHSKGKSKADIILAIDNYRISIGLNPIKRKA